MLKHAKSSAWLLLGGIVCAIGAVADGQQAAPQPQAKTSAIETEIRASADAFVEAFGKRDAAAVAALWTPDGVYVNEDGARFEGRKAIQSEYEALFKLADKDLGVRIEVDSVRQINAQTTIEEGRVALTPQPPGGVRVMSQYTAVHAKQSDGKWLVADVREVRVVLPVDAGQLENLEWLVGTWTAARGDSQFEQTCRWTKNKHFLERMHNVTTAGKSTSAGREIIGFDPSTGRITSWSFDSDGGHAVGIWAPHANGWLIDAQGVLADGTFTTATYTLSHKGDGELSWKSINRSVGGVLLPDTGDIVLKRK